MSNKKNVLLILLLFWTQIIHGEPQEYQEITLNQAIEGAIKKSIDIEKNRFNISQIEKKEKLYYLSLLPTFNISLQNSNRIIRNEIDQENLNISFKISQPLFDAGELINSIRLIKNSRKIEKEKNSLQTKKLSSIIKTNYYKLKLLQDEIVFREKEKKSWNKMILIAKEQYKQNLIREIDLEQIELNGKKLKNRYIAAKNRLEMGLSTFSLQTGIKLKKSGNIRFITNFDLKSLKLKDKFEEIKSIATKNSPQNRAYKFQKEKLKINRDALLCSMLPKIEYSATIGEEINNGYHYTPPIEHGIAITVTLPGISFKNRVGISQDPLESSVATSTSSEGSAKNYLQIQNLILIEEEKKWQNREEKLYQEELINQLKNRIDQIEKLQESIEIEIESHKLQKKEFKIATEQYRNGEVPLYRINNLSNEYQKQFIQINEIKQELFSAIDQLAQLIGIPEEELNELE